MKVTIGMFLSQVKQEALKVSWPSKKEVITSTIVVIVMLVFFSGFFLLIDILIHYLIQTILGLRS
ncbi:preprotein translocase subunit SecE [Rickettsiales bacterium Ac37b]|nr:preprotein translocase subunit SecE [Rickettsiales bacterium Ac37b]